MYLNVVYIIEIEWIALDAKCDQKVGKMFVFCLSKYVFLQPNCQRQCKVQRERNSRENRPS